MLDSYYLKVNGDPEFGVNLGEDFYVELDELDIHGITHANLEEEYLMLADVIDGDIKYAFECTQRPGAPDINHLETILKEVDTNLNTLHSMENVMEYLGMDIPTPEDLRQYQANMEDNSVNKTEDNDPYGLLE